LSMFHGVCVGLCCSIGIAEVSVAAVKCI